MTLSISRDEFRNPASLKTQVRAPPSPTRRWSRPSAPCCWAWAKTPTAKACIDTPQRVVKALKFLTSGYHQSLDDLLNGAVFHENTNEMVLVRDIDLFSSCEHHILPILGRAHVAYIPDGKVIGLSKVARICEMYARRLQVQERLTAQIADALEGSAETPRASPSSSKPPTCAWSCAASKSPAPGPPPAPCAAPSPKTPKPATSL
jgi:GTP cyclohydrolase I